VWKLITDEPSRHGISSFSVATFVTSICSQDGILPGVKVCGSSPVEQLVKRNSEAIIIENLFT
jgi:hypothetical protein